MPNNAIGFANLSQSQLDQIKQTEATLNSQLTDKNEELILLAYTKPNQQ